MTLSTATGEHALTVEETIVALMKGVQDGLWKDTDVLLTAVDPEGNGYVAFTQADLLNAVPVRVKDNGPLRPGIAFDGTPDAILVPAMFEVDPW